MTLEEKIRSREASIGVVGLGYVGLPLAVLFARRGFSTVGFDVDASKLQSVASGSSYIPDVLSEELSKHVNAGRLRAAQSFDDLAEVDAILICVPTPLRKTKDPDISYIVAAVEQIAPRLRRGHLVVLESTTYPGTTEEIVLPALEAGGLAVGRDFHLAFSPERVDPGNARFHTANTPKVVGGITPECTRVAAALYQGAVDHVHPVSSARTAEMVKLLENTFRAVNIALVNEIALMCERIGVSVWDVIDAAATKPFGFMPFYPGPGIGGHCIPLDPHYLSWKMKTLNFHSKFIELAADVNGSMPEHVVRRIIDVLNDSGRSVRGSRILVLGVAYKRDTSDVRESPAMDIIRLLETRGARIAYNDPLIPEVRPGEQTYTSTELTEDSVGSADCVVIVTDHAVYDYAWIVAHAKKVFDTRNAARKARGAGDTVIAL